MTRNCSRLDVISSKLASVLFRRSAAKAIAPRKDSLPPPPHDLTLYEYEASPWCRLVREQATILDLNLNIRPCPRESIPLQGAYTKRSRFRPMAHQALQTMEKERGGGETWSFTFPILVDNTNTNKTKRVVLKESYHIVEHLWENYGQNVLPTGDDKSRRRPDQVVNSPKIPFPIRFLFLSGPSYFRCLPHQGVMRVPSIFFDNHQQSNTRLTLYQAEGCPSSRLVREILCSLELPYLSVSCAKGSPSFNVISEKYNSKEIPVLVVEETDPNDNDNDINNINDTKHMTETTFVGHEAIVSYLWQEYHDSRSEHQPTWFDRIPEAENLGLNGAFGPGAYTAFLQGRRAFVPSIVQK